jgi:hypothetical protein
MDPTDNETEGLKYPDAAARRLLASTNPTTFRREIKEATQLLLAQFAGLLKEYGYSYSYETPDSVRVETRNGPVDVSVSGSVVTLSYLDRAHSVPLSYNPHTKLLEGIDDDPDIVPIPGELRARSNALTLIAHMVIKAGGVAPEP